MRIQITTIPHSEQRYETVGDWLTAHGQLRHIRVSDMGNEDYALLVGLHELIESWLCIKRGITQEAVDGFDIEFEKRRVPGNTDEPGHDPDAPYRREHVFAEKIEQLMAEELGIDWDEYSRVVEEL